MTSLTCGFEFPACLGWRWEFLILREVLSDSEGADIYWKMEKKKKVPCSHLISSYRRGKPFETLDTLRNGILLKLK